MLHHVYKADGINHLLFHMEQSDGWEYSFRQVGHPVIPAELCEWSHPVQAHQRKVIVSPHAPGFPVEVRWRKLGARRWRKAALREVGECWLDLKLTALVDVDLKDFGEGLHDLRFVALVRGDVAAYGADVDSLRLSKGESVTLKCKAASCSVNNIITDADQFLAEDDILRVESIGSTRKAFVACPAPAVAQKAVENPLSFVVKSGGRMDKSELDKLKKELKGG